MLHRLPLLLALALLLAFAAPATAQPPARPVLPDGPAFLVRAINSGTQPSLPQSLTAVGTQVFFTADDGVHGRELWVSDGTNTTTLIVKDITPGPDSSSISDMTNVNGTLFFTVNGTLWKSDGTDVGTLSLNNQAANLTSVNSALFFTSSVCVFYFGGIDCTFSLWKIDSTGVNAAQLHEYGDTRVDSLVNVNGTLFFAVDDELWTSDGTPAGTMQVRSGLVGLQSFTNVNGRLFFVVSNGTNHALWISDGTSSGTMLVKDQLSNVMKTVSAGKTLFFVTSENNSFALWRSDGTQAGTMQLTTNLTWPDDVTTTNGMVFFTTNEVNGDIGLRKSDGTVAGTTLIAYVTSGVDPALSLNRFPLRITGAAGKVFFAARDAEHGVEPWQSDGTAAGTMMVQDIAPGADGSYPSAFTPVGSRLFFVASDPRSANELWTSDGTAQGTSLVADINPVAVSLSSSPTPFGSIGNALLFAADDGVHGRELWRSNGTTAGTTLVKDVFPGPTSGMKKTFAFVGDTLFFATLDAQGNEALWRSDGTEAGTVKVRDFPASPRRAIYDLTAVNDILFFAYGSMLWRSDGTESGTIGLADFESVDQGIYSIGALTTMNDMLFFGAGCNLWTSDGTDAGTVPVKSIENDGTCSFPYALTSVNNTLFFGQTSQGSAELWTSDGTETGTTRVQAIDGEWDTAVRAGGKLFFAVHGDSGSHLWRSDGTGSGTEPVQEFPHKLDDLTAVGKLLFFVHDSAGVPELWVSDGTSDGAHLVMTLRSGMPAGSTLPLATIGTTLVFGAPEATGHYDLYRSDGTAVGTQRVQTFRPSGGQPNDQQPPHDFTLAGDHLFFSADGGTGQELWAIPTSEGVMASLRAPPALHASPDGMLTIPVRYDNTGFTATHGLTLTATLDPALKYLGSTGSITPTMQGNMLVWQAPDLGFLEHGEVQVQVQALDSASGSPYPVSFRLDAAGDTTPDDNTQVIEVVISQQIFLPLLDR